MPQNHSYKRTAVAVYATIMHAVCGGCRLMHAIGGQESSVAAEEKASYWSVVEPIWTKVNIHDEPDRFLAQFRQLPQAVGDLYAAHWLVSEVVNGAFPQFFSNSTGVLAPEAVTALKRMGLAEAAEIVESFMTFFGDEYPRGRAERSELIDWVWEKQKSDAQEHNLDIMLELSGQFLDAVGNNQELFDRAADSYAKTYLMSV